MTPEYLPILLISDDPRSPQFIEGLLAEAALLSPSWPPIRVKNYRWADFAPDASGVAEAQAVLLHLLPDEADPAGLVNGVRELLPELPLIAFAWQIEGTLGRPLLQTGGTDVLHLGKDAGQSLAWAVYAAVTARRARRSGVERVARDYFLHAAPVGYYRTTAEDYILEANPALARMLGYAAPDELIGMKVEQVGSSLEYSRSVFRQLIEKEGRITDLESIWVKKDGSTLRVRESARAIREESGQILNYEGLVEDITQQVHLEKALEATQARWGGILDTSMDAVITINQAQRIVYMNAAAEQMFGYPLNELGGATLDLLIPGRFRDAHLKYVKAFGNSETVQRRMGKLGVVWGLRADGEEFPMEASLSKVDVSGHTYYTAIIRDITVQLRAQEELKLAAAVYESTSEGIMIADAKGRVISVNEAFTAITGYEADEVIGKNPRFLKSGRHDPKFYEDMWKTLLETNSWRGEIWNRRKDGDIYPEWLTITAVRDESGRVSKYIAIFIDISARVQNEELLRFLATHDPLTNLPNRELFRGRLKRALARAQRSHQKVVVLLMDLDGFKEINDSLGHVFGDQVLQDLAVRLMDCMRESDTIARLGGDEFTVVLEGITDLRDVDVVLSKLQETINRPFQLNGHEVRISSSMGISVYPDDGEDPELLIQQADLAMYRAKEIGKGCYRYFEQSQTSDPPGAPARKSH